MSEKKKSSKNEVVAYCRTSSQVNVGKSDNYKHSYKRQIESIEIYCKNKKLKLVKVFYDKNVSGALSPELRVELSKCLEFCKNNNITKVLVEDASRLSRNLVQQEMTYVKLVSQNINIVCASNDTIFSTGNDFIRQIYGAINEENKRQIVSRLQSAKKHKIEENKKNRIVTLNGKNGKCGGGVQYYLQNYKDIKKKILSIKNSKPKKSLRSISRILFTKHQISNTKNEPISPVQISRILKYKISQSVTQ